MQVRLSYTIHDEQIFSDPEDAERELEAQFEMLKRKIAVEGLTWLLAQEVAVLVEELNLIGQYTRKI
jgi:hypothetical protein